MADLTYLVTIEHRDRGVGFTARTALQNAQKQGTSPIKQAKFSGQPTGSHTDIEVTIDDASLRETIIGAIDVSGRMPSKPGLYSIRSVELQRGEADLEELQRHSKVSQRQLASLREENARLRQGLTSSRIEVNTPLEGLLTYFATTNYSTGVILDDSADLDFARRVFGENIENKFVNYANHVLGENLSEEDIERVLAYKPKAPEEMSELHLRYEAAKKELGFLEKLKSGETEIPETLRDDYIRVIEVKGHGETVREYMAQVQAQENAESNQEKLRQLKDKYDSFSEKMDLLNQAGGIVPVIFNFKESGVELYFPFNVRDVKSGFIGDLRTEVETHFGNATVESLEHKFVAYQVTNGSNCVEGVDHLVNDTPITLRVAGFDKITPYRLG